MEERSAIQTIVDGFKVLFASASAIGQIIKAFHTLSLRIGELIRQLPVPGFTEEIKEALLVSYQTWGSFGWTPAPEMPFNCFYKPPIDRKTANREMLKYCSDKEMQAVFDRLKNLKGVKRSDLEEAIFCFENRKYKSCIMIMYAMLDSKFIRMQKDKDRNPSRNSETIKRRKSGKGAGTNILNRYLTLPQEEQTLYRLLHCNNLLSCIATLFSDAKDFAEQPPEATRNFIDHGMLFRPVKRMDCIKVFLLYYNFMSFTQKYLD